MGLSHLLFLPRDARAVFAIWPCLFVRLSQLGLLLQHSFNGLFSRTTSVSRYQKGKTSLDLNGARDDGVLGWQWLRLDHMQTICTSLQADNHTNTSSLTLTGRMLFLTPNQQCQSTEGVEMFF